MIDATHLSALAAFLDGLSELSMRTSVVIHTSGRVRPDLEINGSYFALVATNDEGGGFHYAVDTEEVDS